MTTVLNLIHVVEAAKQRLDPRRRKSLTYFSVHDVWLFQARSDTKVCPVCDQHDATEEFRGNHLRAQFPYLEVVDLFTIKVNVHPNCRCFLSRLITEENGKKKSEELGAAGFYETSAKTGDAIDQAFELMTKKSVAYFQED